MKKLIGLIAIVMLCCTSMFAACLSIHEHTFAEGWAYDETNHWHEATCEHTDKKGMFSAHNYGEWKVVDSPEDGVVTMQRTCTVCKYTETKTEGEHEHTFAESWTYDETNHWHAATCEHTDNKGMLSAHNYGEWKVVDSPEDGVVTMQRTCTVCKYTETKTEGEHEHTFAESWTYDETNHWHAATCEHTAEKSGFESHVFGDGVETTEGVKYTCNTCGYVKTEISEYTVTPEEYTTILNAISVFKANLTTAYGEEIMFVTGGNVCLYQSHAFTDYYIYDGTEYYMISKDYEEDYFVKEVCTQQIYENNTSGWSFFPYLLNSFADLSYDMGTRSYKAEEINVTIYEDYSFKIRNISLSFKDLKLNAATLSFVRTDEDGTETVDVYSYSDIGTASVELPTNIHEHTYSAEWSADPSKHFHTATCKHSSTKIDVEAHTFVKGVCTVCGYNILVLSDDGKTVLGISDNEAKEVTIPQGVTAIGGSALADCALTEIVIPEGVTSIGNFAFQGCFALASVSLPEGLLTIGERAFDNCTVLTSIKTPSTLQNIEYCSFANCTNLKTVILSEGAKTIGNLAFKGCQKLTEIYIPESLTEIKQNVFDGASLSKIYYSGNKAEWAAITKNKYNSVLNAATVYCYSETDPDETGNFWHYDEDGNAALWPVHTFAEDWSYDETDHWHEATCEHTDKKSAFGPHDLAVEETAAGTMYSCVTCGYTVVKESIYKVSEEVFDRQLDSANNYKFTAIVEDSGEISYFYFDGVTVNDLYLGTYYTFDGEKYYSYSQEKGYDDYVKTEIPADDYNEEISYIDGLLPLLKGFYSNLTYDYTTKYYTGINIIIEDTTVPKILFRFENGVLKEAKIYQTEDDCFTYSEIGEVSIELPANIHEHTFDTENWVCGSDGHWHAATCRHTDVHRDYAEHTWQNGVCTVCGYNVLKISADGTTVLSVENENVTSFTFPAGVTAIGANAFESCKMTGIVLPEGIETIGNYAFASCVNLSAVTLPSTLKSIGNYSFEDCTALTAISIPQSVTEIGIEAFAGSGLINIVVPDTVTSLGNMAFSRCASLVTAKLSGMSSSVLRDTFEGCTSLVVLELPEGVKIINGKSFADSTGLMALVLPKSLEAINESVFAGPLFYIYYKGTSADWGKIIIAPSSKTYIDIAKIFYYSENEPVEDGNFWRYVDGEIVEWHRHTFNTDWSYDETQHWHAATCEHTDKKSGLSTHSFTEIEETEAGTVYTCYCGYTETRASRYKVSEEEFANLLKGALNFRVTVGGIIYDYNNLSYKVQYSDGSVRYYTSNNMDYFVYYREDGIDDWIKEPISRTEYMSKAGRMNQLPYIAELFADLTYDVSQKCYKGTKVMSGGNELTELFCYFADGQLSAVEFVTQGIRFTYNEFNRVDVAIPANIHSHSYSTEWSSNGSSHWRSANCGHSGKIDEGFHYFNDTECTVCGYALLELSPDGTTVVGLNSSDVTSVKIPQGVTAIGNNVFNFSLITEIVIPEGVKTIGKEAFLNCDQLTKVTFPSTLESIGESAFNACSELTSIDLPQSLTSIGNYAFAECTALTSLTIPDSVTSLSASAYKDCSSITTIKLPGCIVNLSMDYFKGCTSLTTLILSEGTSKLLNNSLADLTSLTSIVIPVSLSAIESSVFADSLVNVYYKGNDASWKAVQIADSSLCVIDVATVYYYSETEPVESGNYWHISSEGEFLVWHVHIYSTEWSIGLETHWHAATCGHSVKKDEAAHNMVNDVCTVCGFDGGLIISEDGTTVTGVANKNVTSITIPEGITTIGEKAFQNCKSLINVVLPSTLTEIGANAFHNCEKLTNVVIPEKVTKIDTYAFNNCAALTSINVPKNVTFIGSWAFSNCINLAELTFSGGVQTIDMYAFATCKTLTEVVLPEGLTTMGSGVFYSCEKLVKVTFPSSSLTKIGGGTFSGCSSLKSVIFPDSLTEMGDANTFNNCTSLEFVKVPGCVDSVGGGLFKSLPNLKTVIISEGTDTLYTYAFRYCSNFTTIVLPKSLTKIMNAVFEDAALSKIYYNGTAEEWAEIYIDDSISKDKVDAATVYYYSETEPTAQGNYWHYVDGMPVEW